MKILFVGQKQDFHSKLADAHAYTIKDFNNFFNIKKISIQDQGHPNSIQGDENIVTILVASQCNMPVQKK